MKQDRRRFLEIAGATTVLLAMGNLPIVAQAATAATDKVKIGVIGSGRLGGALGGVWVKQGYEVMFSSLDIEHDRALAAKLGTGARAGIPREAVAFGDVVLLAVPFSAVSAIGKDLGNQLKGKVLIDATNPIINRDGDIAKWAREKGAGLASAELLPGARIVRAFNGFGSGRMAVAHQEGKGFGMPMASDDAKAVALVSPLVRDIGYEPVLVGGLAMGKYLMPGAELGGERSTDEIRRIAATLK